MTGRLPFDPERVPDADVGKPARRERKRYGEFAGDRPLTVTQAAELLKRVLADRMPSPVKIVGEVSNFSDRQHWFFSLKDETNVISCVMWASAAGKMSFTPEHGQEVVATGRFDYYGPQGRLQVYVEKLEPVGAGALELRFRQMCDELRAAGYFDESRKKAMPVFPEHLAVVTSRTGAAVRDVISTARARWPGIRLSVVDVRVQGAGAAEEIAAAIDWLSAAHKRLEVDAIVLTRGGGSLEDLWAFNERVVAEAVYGCAAPIAVGVGHETDTTIAELVADLRCATPTQCAARLVPDAEAERHRLDSHGERLRLALRRRAETARSALDALATRPMFQRPAERLAALRREVAHEATRLAGALRTALGQRRTALAEARHALARREPAAQLRLARERVETASRDLAVRMAQRLKASGREVEALRRELEAIGPRAVLDRGYSYTTDGGGKLVRSAKQVGEGDRLRTHLVDGVVDSRVEGAGQRRVRRRKRRGEAGSDEAGLFDGV